MVNKSAKGIFPIKDIQLVRGFVNRIQKDQTSANGNMIHTNRYYLKKSDKLCTLYLPFNHFIALMLISILARVAFTAFYFL